MGRWDSSLVRPCCIPISAVSQLYFRFTRTNHLKLNIEEQITRKLILTFSAKLKMVDNIFLPGRRDKPSLASFLLTEQLKVESRTTRNSSILNNSSAVLLTQEDICFQSALALSWVLAIPFSQTLLKVLPRGRGLTKKVLQIWKL